MSRNCPSVQGTEEGVNSILCIQHSMIEGKGMTGIKKKKAGISGLKSWNIHFKVWNGQVNIRHFRKAMTLPRR